MTAFLFIGGILAIGTAGACIVANVLRKLSENTADDNADGDASLLAHPALRDRALVSDRAASRLAPSGFDPLRGE